MNIVSNPKTLALLRKVIKRDGPNCWLCGNPVGPAARTLDHAIPKSKGGTRSVHNLRLAHKSCNVRRGAIESAKATPPRAAAVRARELFGKIASLAR